MADSTDPMKLSSFVSSIVDRKLKMIAISLIAVAASLRDHTTKLTKLKTFQDRFARGSNQYGNWELRPGIIEMWGRYTGTPDREAGQTVSFPLSLPNKTYHLGATPIIATANTAKDIGVQIVEASRQAASALVFYQSSTADASQKLDGFDWRVMCVVPFDYVPVENTTTPPTGTGDSSGTGRISLNNSRSEV